MTNPSLFSSSGFQEMEAWAHLILCGISIQILLSRQGSTSDLADPVEILIVEHLDPVHFMRCAAQAVQVRGS